MAFDINIGPNVRKSPFFEATVADGVRSFSVYNHMYLPGHYGDPDAEYDRLLNGVAMWDVGAQRQVEITWPDAAALIQYLTPRDLSGQMPGQGRYVPMADHDGLLINDPVCLKLSSDRFWLSVADSDIWLWTGAIARERGFRVEVREPDVSPLAIQGPKAVEVAASLFGERVRDVGKFRFFETSLEGIPLLVARSGWSKQGGFELYLRAGDAGTRLWNIVKEAGRPFGIGPGAPNDAERIESGLISYGADARHATHPADLYEMGFGDMIALGHEFVGRDALRDIAARGHRRHRIGVLIEGGAVVPNKAPVELMQGELPVGYVSEIVNSPRLGQGIGIGLARTDITARTSGLRIDTEDGPRDVTVTDLPFL